jgi:hypothetical protein
MASAQVWTLQALEQLAAQGALRREGEQVLDA